MQTKVLIGFNTAKEGVYEVAAKVSVLLRENGMCPCVWGTDSVYAEKIGAEVAKSPAEGSFLVTVGGDGTLIKWGKIVAKFKIPLLGVNMGRLGFMATLEPVEAPRVRGELRGYGGFPRPCGRRDTEHAYGLYGVLAVGGGTYSLAGSGVHRVHGAVPAYAVQSPYDFFR